MSKKKCYTNSVHGEDCKNQARYAESQTQGRAEFARTNTLVDRATAGPQPAREEVAVLEEARTKCSERGHVNDCLLFTELSPNEKPRECQKGKGEFGYTYAA